jgi:2-hydroxychromene-2-carboxylate isomerase
MPQFSFDFYLGIGSRYSYLLATQSHQLTLAGAALRWHPIYSPELIGRVGVDPFTPSARRGQYVSSYRSDDANRWAAHYGVPYIEPEFDAIDWRRIALWAVAAKLLGCGETFSRWALERTFAKGHPPESEDDLREGAEMSGVEIRAIIETVENGSAERDHAASIDAALASGVFGVPSLVAADGTLFWGQDKLPLILDHLRKHT